KYLFFKKELQVIESLSLEQLRQLLDIINDLYNCHVIHRDICPQNLMLDYDTNHIKLIDFGCAITYDINDKAGSIETRGTTIYAELQILDVLAGISCDLTVGACYAYERTFDLQCSLNIIISMNNIDIKEKIYSFEILTDTHKTQLKILQFWKDTQRENQLSYVPHGDPRQTIFKIYHDTIANGTHVKRNVTYMRQIKTC
ncbi:unnamed protein product, partial [Rotaria sp. Silwood1]